MAHESTKKKRREAVQERERARRRTRYELAALIAVGAVVLGGWYAWREVNRPGESVASMGRQHVPQGALEAAYNSNPPTSGPHASPTRWGEHSQPIPGVNQVHNLEHGGVVIQYNCELGAIREACGDARQELRAVLAEARNDIDPKIILAPSSSIERPVALTAWRRVQYLSAVDKAAILRFATANINRAPEQLQ